MVSLECNREVLDWRKPFEHQRVSPAALRKLAFSWEGVRATVISRERTMESLRKLFRKRVVLEVMGWPNATLYKNIQDHLFVTPVKIGERSSAWPSDEVAVVQDAYIAGSTKEALRALVLELEAARKAPKLGERAMVVEQRNGGSTIENQWEGEFKQSTRPSCISPRSQSLVSTSAKKFTSTSRSPKKSWERL
jgi:prophage regulatory protein